MRSCANALLLTLVLNGASLRAQQALSADDSSTIQAVTVFIDCGGDCAGDYTKTEITFVNFVRDRAEADVHIIVSTLKTAAGGTEYTIEFRGQRKFEGMVDTLKTYTLESDSEDTARKKLVKTYKLGLMRFVARTPLGNDVNVTYSRPALKTERIDKWKGWVFSIDASTYFNGEKSTRYLNLYGNLQARRVTEKNRFTLNVYSNYVEDRRSYGDYEVKSISRSRGSELSFLFGLDDHWSLGIGTETFMSSYSNYDNVWELYPTCEYNIFPYSQSTRRQLRLQYLVAARYNDYRTETIYNRTTEWLGIERLSVNLKFIQPWGSMEVWTSASHYFQDMAKNRVQVGGNLSLKLVKGLSLTMDGSYARIHDLLGLAKGDATQEELLLQRRQLATSYSYYGSIGVKYSFGSIYSNVVNPRFGF